MGGLLLSEMLCFHVFNWHGCDVVVDAVRRRKRKPCIEKTGLETTSEDGVLVGGTGKTIKMLVLFEECGGESQEELYAFFWLGTGEICCWVLKTYREVSEI